ncbi:alpha/beta hydrolase [uncultured Tenacibaculum sp.]|uniref:alpha/beta hydrolase n=1 Tax=uncultured Tenacibaculum sp. TaxID=174713 RepID=UPI0026234AB8|nr:alpha/beta hydrolase [uncultured Tenacibaculum sp.]
MKKRYKLLITFLLFLGIGIYVIFNNVAPYAIIKPPRVSITKTPKDLNLDFEEITVNTQDSLTLNGYWIKSQHQQPKGILILLHGIGGCKEHFLELSETLAISGIESILFDGRAHGKSEGEFCTYGFYEKNDVSKIVDLIKTKAPNLKIGIWGNSLGGAIALQTLENDKRIAFGVIESTFTELDQIVFQYKKNLLKGFGIKFLSDFSLKKAGEIANFNPDKVKPIQAVKNISQPVLIAHGSDDRNIPIVFGKQLFKNLASKDKKFINVKDGGHHNLFEKGGITYKKELLDFINRNLDSTKQNPIQ